MTNETAEPGSGEDRLVGADRVIAVLTELADHPLGGTLDELASILDNQETDSAPRAGDPSAPRAEPRLATLKNVIAVAYARPLRSNSDVFPRPKNPPKEAPCPRME